MRGKHPPPWNILTFSALRVQHRELYYTVPPHPVPKCSILVWEWWEGGGMLMPGGRVGIGGEMFPNLLALSLSPVTSHWSGLTELYNNGETCTLHKAWWARVRTEGYLLLKWWVVESFKNSVAKFNFEQMTLNSLEKNGSGSREARWVAVATIQRTYET